MSSSEGGATVLESVFAVALLMIMTVGSIQVVLLLYARNVVHASAHEAARTAIERGARDDVAVAVARQVVHGSVGGIARRLDVGVEHTTAGTQKIVRVRVTAVLEAHGPVPVTVPVHAVARIAAPSEPR